jgi:hypothetical protein
MVGVMRPFFELRTIDGVAGERAVQGLNPSGRSTGRLLGGGECCKTCFGTAAGAGRALDVRAAGVAVYILIDQGIGRGIRQLHQRNGRKGYCAIR